jgi:hypothetical protein
MFRHLRLEFRFVVALTALACCCSASNDRINPVSLRDVPPEKELVAEEYEQVEAEEDAEVILVVETLIPGATRPDTFRFPLRLRRIEPTPHGGSSFSSGFAWRGCGGLGSSGGSVGLQWPIPTEGNVKVSLQLDWSRPNNNNGEVDTKVAIPWMGEVTREVGSGVRVRGHFAKPEPRLDRTIPAGSK